MVVYQSPNLLAHRGQGRRPLDPVARDSRILELEGEACGPTNSGKGFHITAVVVGAVLLIVKDTFGLELAAPNVHCAAVLGPPDRLPEPLIVAVEVAEPAKAPALLTVAVRTLAVAVDCQSIHWPQVHPIEIGGVAADHATSDDEATRLEELPRISQQLRELGFGHSPGARTFVVSLIPYLPVCDL